MAEMQERNISTYRNEIVSEELEQGQVWPLILTQKCPNQSAYSSASRSADCWGSPAVGAVFWSEKKGRMGVARVTVN